LVQQVAVWHIFGTLASFLVIFGMFGIFVTFGTPVTDVWYSNASNSV